MVIKSTWEHRADLGHQLCPVHLSASSSSPHLTIGLYKPFQVCKKYIVHVFTKFSKNLFWKCVINIWKTYCQKSIFRSFIQMKVLLPPRPSLPCPSTWLRLMLANWCQKHTKHSVFDQLTELLVFVANIAVFTIQHFGGCYLKHCHLEAAWEEGGKVCSPFGGHLNQINQFFID